jgi:hypothetical protein
MGSGRLAMEGFMSLRTSSNREGPYLVITKRPPGTTEEQITHALEAAHQVFEDAGVDPVEAGYQDAEDPARRRFLVDLWEAAERAATAVCWAPRIGTPEPTKIDIYTE